MRHYPIVEPGTNFAGMATHPQVTFPTRAIRLMDLPTELRIKIAEYALTYKDGKCRFSNKDNRWFGYSCLTCRSLLNGQKFYFTAWDYGDDMIIPSPYLRPEYQISS